MNLFTNSKILSLKYVLSLLRAKSNSKNKVEPVDLYYDGIESEKLELKYFRSPRPLGRTLILYPGASPQGENHPSMLFLASILAEIGFNIYIPRIPLLKKLNISEDNIEWFDNAYKRISLFKEVQNTKVSCMGVSYGGALLLKASLSGSMYENPPHCIFTYGTIYDIPTSLDFLMTGKLTIKNKEVQIKPHEWGLVVGFYNFLPTIDVGYKTDAIMKVLSIRVKDKKDESFIEANKLDGKIKELTLDVLNGKISKEVNRIINIIQSDQIHLLDSISPKHFCKDIKIKSFIMHGANDNMVPYTQSIKLANSLNNSELFVSYLYEHNEIAPKRSIYHKLKELYRITIFFQKFIKFHED